MMMFNVNCPLDIPPLSHSSHGPLSSPHSLHPGPDIKPPALIHADEDAYASLPPTPTSPFDFAPPSAGWHSVHHSPLAQSQPECGRGMYNMGPGLGHDMGPVTIAGSGQYMNVSICRLARMRTLC